MLDRVRDAGLHLEVCPTSNVHTGAAPSVAAHPITALWRAGVSLSYHTDNRLMSCLSHSSEAAALLRETSLGTADLLAMTVQAARHSFLGERERTAAEAVVRAHAASLGLDLPA
jgi:adenosine deaminase